MTPELEKCSCPSQLPIFLLPTLPLLLPTSTLSMTPSTAQHCIVRPTTPQPWREQQIKL